VSRSFAVVIQQLPQELQDPVCIFYLVLRGLDSVEDDMVSDTHRLFLAQRSTEDITALAARVRLCASGAPAPAFWCALVAHPMRVRVLLLLTPSL